MNKPKVSISNKLVLLFVSFVIPALLTGQDFNTGENRLIHSKVTLTNNYDIGDSKYWPWTITYDNGDAEEYAAWIQSGGYSMVRFTPPFHPCSVRGGQLYIGDGSFPEGGEFLGTEVNICVFDSRSDTNLPGNLLNSINITVDDYFWLNFDSLLYAEIYEGDFYLGMKQLGTAPNVAPIGIDTDLPTVYRSFARQNDSLEWFLSPYQDYMIRANIDAVTSLENNTSDHKIKIYPNPATHQVSLESEIAFDLIEIYSLNGKLLKTKRTSSSKKTTLNIGSLSMGTYTIKIICGNQYFLRKLIIK